MKNRTLLFVNLGISLLSKCENILKKKQGEYDSIPKVYVIHGNEPIDIVCRVDRGVTGRDVKDNASHMLEYDELRFISGRVLSDDEYIKSSADLILSSY